MTDLCSNQLTLQWNQRKEAGLQAMNEANFVHAENLYSDALRCAKSFGENDLRVVQSHMLLADARMAQQKWAEAESSLREALQILKRSQWHEHPDIASIHLTLGRLYYMQGHMDVARIQARKSYELCEFLFGPEHALLVPPLILLGEIDCLEERWDRGWETVLRARSLLETHPDACGEDEQQRLQASYERIRKAVSS